GVDAHRGLSVRRALSFVVDSTCGRRENFSLRIELMRTFLLFAALLFAPLAPAADKPSRAADKECQWEKVSDTGLGLDAWVQRCDFRGRKINLYAKGNALMQHYSDGGEDEKLIETFDRRDG